MKAKKYRAAVVGCGKVGVLFEEEKSRPVPRSHAGAIAANAKTELGAIVDTDLPTLARASKLFPRAKTYKSASVCLKAEQVDLVVISTPTSVRLSLIKECIDAGVKMIICEKPLASSLKEAHAIEKLVKDSKVVFIVNYQRRFSKLFARVRTDLRSGKLGRIQAVSAYYSNGIRNNGGHAIDALRYLLDEPIARVAGFLNDKDKTHPADDTNIDGLMWTRGGTAIALQSLDQAAYGIHDIKIFGEKGSVSITDYGATAIWTPARPSAFKGVSQLDHAKSRTIRQASGGAEDTLAHAISSFESGEKPESGIGNGIEALQVLEALQMSARSDGKAVLL